MAGWLSLGAAGLQRVAGIGAANTGRGRGAAMLLSTSEVVGGGAGGRHIYDSVLSGRTEDEEDLSPLNLNNGALSETDADEGIGDDATNRTAFSNRTANTTRVRCPSNAGGVKINYNQIEARIKTWKKQSPLASI